MVEANQVVSPELQQIASTASGGGGSSESFVLMRVGMIVKTKWREFGGRDCACAVCLG